MKYFVDQLTPIDRLKFTLRRMISVLICLIATSLSAQIKEVNVSGTIRDASSDESLPFVNVVLLQDPDSVFVSGTISNEQGLFEIKGVKPGDYLLQASFIGYTTYSNALFIGSNSAFIDLGNIRLNQQQNELGEVTISANLEGVAGAMDKKSYTLDANLSQTGGSVLQAMQNLPGVTTRDGQIQLRGSNQVVVLIDGRQTAITGFGKQNGLDNIPASAIERIEIINNPSAKYDANGNAGIINIIMKKEEQMGFNGKIGLNAGLGALWVRKENLPGIRPQYQATPKINPSASINYRSKKVNYFLQADNLYTQTLNRNEFVTRTYDDGTVIQQQLKRNRNTNFFTSSGGIDWFMDKRNSLSLSGMYSRESIKDYGDQPFFSGNTGENLRLWQFLEDEVLTAAMFSTAYEHRFTQPGHSLKAAFNYTFDREDEKYFFTNSTHAFNTEESFFLIADQKVADFNLDYARPTKHGLLETGFKLRNRSIPTNMQFNPSSANSVLDTGADGKAVYRETIPAIYGNYTYEVRKMEAEIGLRLEYVNLRYEVDPDHNTYQSDGYTYLQPFPNIRLTYKINDRQKISAFFNRRVDRPDEGDIRIFPKYDDAEIIKVGNPALQPQFTKSIEIGYRQAWTKGSLYFALYHRMSDGTITRVATTVDSTDLIYNTSQNAGRSYNSGGELIIDQVLSEKFKFNLNLNAYRNQINAFTVNNLYPIAHTFTAEQQEIITGNLKVNAMFTLAKNTEAQVTAVYLAPDIIPQGKIDQRFSLDCGLKRSIQNGKGELFINATDLLNTMVIRREIRGNNFSYTSANYYETQVIRFGYTYKF